MDIGKGPQTVLVCGPLLLLNAETHLTVTGSDFYSPWEGRISVSYTHLDVYKRQVGCLIKAVMI